MMTFKELHQQTGPLLLGNVWDVMSAQTAEKLHFQAIGTSSSAVAKVLGYQDGEEMDFSELEYMVTRISASIRIPLSVDLEGGYSREPDQIANHIKRLVAVGVVGINLEDSVPGKARQLLDAEEFGQSLSSIKKELDKEGLSIFINVRTDPFLLGHPNPVEESIKRIACYEAAGADGIFTPCIVKEKDIEVIVKNTPLPINVMCMPNLPDFETLKALGVKRISMGSFVFNKAYQNFGDSLKMVVNQKSFNSIF